MIKYYFYRLLSSMFGHEWIVRYYRRTGMSIGQNTHIFSRLSTSEPYLISIGDNVTVATDVKLLTHDASIGAIGNRIEASDMCGRIHIGNNCFLGAGSIIMPGVCIGDRVIIAAGSVVTHSQNTPSVIIAGNPARVICTIDEYIEKHKNHFLKLHGLSYLERKNEVLNNEDKLLIK